MYALKPEGLPFSQQRLQFWSGVPASPLFSPAMQAVPPPPAPVAPASTACSPQLAPHFAKARQDVLALHALEKGVRQGSVWERPSMQLMQAWLTCAFGLLQIGSVTVDVVVDPVLPPVPEEEDDADVVVCVVLPPVLVLPLLLQAVIEHQTDAAATQPNTHTTFMTHLR
jgi:hypothetical protein